MSYFSRFRSNINITLTLVKLAGTVSLTASSLEAVAKVSETFTYFAVSMIASSMEAAQDDSRMPPARDDCIATASDMALGSHSVSEMKTQCSLVVLQIHTQIWYEKKYCRLCIFHSYSDLGCSFKSVNHFKSIMMSAGLLLQEI